MKGAVERGSFEPIEVGECLVVARGNFLAACNEIGQALELTTTKGALEIGNTVVIAEFLHFVIPRPLLRKGWRRTDGGVRRRWEI